MQSLRNTVTRHPLSSSRTSLSSEKNKKDEILNSSIINDEDTTISSKIKDEPSKSSMYYLVICIRRGLVVRISAFHAGGPGSIPGVGILFFLCVLCFIFLLLLNILFGD